ncbi:hypothetical protein [Streptomyces sp. NPDC086776]|uniref:hypothetical protein n=1 Tax=Streptomyces sp. NPDC086776 TaxID=3365756 RepID=UPI0038257ACC
MFKITTEWYRQRTVKGRTVQKQTSSETEEAEWPDGVAEFIAQFLYNRPGIVFSGMEDFGQGGCVLDPVSLRCRAYGDCRRHHIESVKEWVEKAVDELKTGESMDFTTGGCTWVSLKVEALETPETD